MFYNYLLTISPCGAAGQLPVAHTGTTTGRCSTNLRFRCRRVIAALSFVFFLSIGQASASADGSIKPGARGEILTALAPGRPTRIGIEILGWIEGTGPGRSLIIGQLMNTDIGVLSGMSGSPVYIDGVLIGALSQAFPFARTPVCAITPMSDMETVWAGAAEVGGAGRVAGSRIFSTEFPTNNKSSGLFSLRHGLSAGLAQPLIALLGFTAADAELAPQLSGIPIGSLSGISASSPRDGTAKLEPGAAVTIPLVLGDREISALGTITQINGEQILAFGHGFLELGVCSLPLGAGNIVATVPNYQIGFKIGSSVGQIGEVLIDHPCGIGARLGKPPEMTEMKLLLHLPQGRTASYSYQVANIPQLTPSLILLNLAESLRHTVRGTGGITLHGKLRFELSNGESIDMVRTAATDSLPGLAAQSFLAPLFYLSGSSLDSLTFKTVTIDIETDDSPRYWQLTHAEVAPCTVRSGENIRVTSEFKEYHGPLNRKSIEITVPSRLPTGDYQVLLMDAQRFNVWRQERQPRKFANPELGSLLEDLRQWTPDNTLHIILSRHAYGLSTANGSYPDAPGRLLKRLRNAPSSSQMTWWQGSAAVSEMISMPGMVVGDIVLPLKITDAP